MTKFKMFQKTRVHPLNMKLVNENNKLPYIKNIRFIDSPIAFFRNKYEKTINRKINIDN